jgi:nucleotide-binding universal stress UspA family protein
MYDRILIPVDGSSISINAAEEGMKLAGILGSSVSFLYVIDLSILSIPDAETGIANAEVIRKGFRDQGDTIMDRLKAGAGDKGVSADTMIREGDVHETILLAANTIKADLIIMGTHGRSGLNRLILGSVAESVARRAGCAVLLIRPEEQA